MGQFFLPNLDSVATNLPCLHFMTFFSKLAYWDFMHHIILPAHAACCGFCWPFGTGEKLYSKILSAIELVYWTTLSTLLNFVMYFVRSRSTRLGLVSICFTSARNLPTHKWIYQVQTMERPKGFLSS